MNPLLAALLILLAQPARSHAWGHGSATYSDGYAAASCPSGPQNPTMFSANGETIRPPWHVAGVDYYVGLCPSVVLADPTTASLPACASLDTVNHIVRVNTANCTISGYDFSLHGGYGVYVRGPATGGSASNTVIDSNYFAVGANAVQPIHMEVDTGSGTISNNTFDGAGAGHVSVDSLIGAPQGTAAWTIKYNAINSAASDGFIEQGCNTLIEWNYTSNAMYFAAAHADSFQFGLNGETCASIRVLYNTAYQAAADGSGTPGAKTSMIAFVSDENGGTFSNVEIGNNSAVALGATGHLRDTGAKDYPATAYYIYVTTDAVAGSAVTGGSVHDNFIDLRGAFGGCYPLAGHAVTGVTWSSNYNMPTGALTCTGN